MSLAHQLGCLLYPDAGNAGARVLEAIDAIYDRMDRDADGTVKWNEIAVDLRLEDGDANRSERKRRAAKLLRTMDFDRDHRLSRAEFRTHASARVAEHMAAGRPREEVFEYFDVVNS